MKYLWMILLAVVGLGYYFYVSVKAQAKAAGLQAASLATLQSNAAENTGIVGTISGIVAAINQKGTLTTTCSGALCGGPGGGVIPVTGI